MTDEGGVLGNLPHSRPGRRSAKRDRPAKAADRAATRAEAGGKPAAAPANRTTPSKGGRAEDGVRVHRDMRGQRGHGSAESTGDPLTAVVRGAVGVAATGVRVGGAVTKELLRRLPRP